MRALLRRIEPLWVRQWRWRRRERRALWTLAPARCDATRLSQEVGTQQLQDLLHSDSVHDEWLEVEKQLSSFRISETSAGVNPGDRRAIFYLLRGLGVRSVLEIGTHIGASTVYAAAALERNCSADSSQHPCLTTVDIVDVNDETEAPWRRVGSTYSPRDILSKMNAVRWVKFVTQRSLEYLQNTEDRFGLIFLDGDHAAETVYQELPASLALLEEGGVILLHDYFPSFRALWPDGIVAPGPFLAIRRLQTEGVPIEVLPLGELPWPTKQGTRVSSLALVVARHS